MLLAQHDTSDDNHCATAAKAAKFFLIMQFFHHVWQVTCGRTNTQLLHKLLMLWAISFIQQCVLVGCLHAYPDGEAFVAQSVGQGTLVVDDED